MLRLRKMIGQLRAVERMVEEGENCGEILAQTVSVRKALKSFTEVVIANEPEACIAGAADPKESKRKMKELLVILKRYVE